MEKEPIEVVEPVDESLLGDLQDMGKGEEW